MAHQHQFKRKNYKSNTKSITHPSHFHTTTHFATSPKIELQIDYLYVKPIPYLHTKWSNLNFLTVHTGENRTENNIEIGIVCVIKVYEARGFKATSVHGDIEFDLDNVKKEYNQK